MVTVIEILIFIFFSHADFEIGVILMTDSCQNLILTLRNEGIVIIVRVVWVTVHFF